MFSPWTRNALPFWIVMTIATGVLAGSAILIDGRRIFTTDFKIVRDLAVGAGFALGLYVFFFVGSQIASMLLPFAVEEIHRVYAPRAQGNLWIIGVMLFCWIGPAEEIFWRGFVQRRIADRRGKRAALVITVGIYTLVHIWSFNLMLLAAAFCCGVVWGWMYYRFGTIRPGWISHAIWDVLIFVLFPIQ
jgi:membrane protease YdiL (CAAX protease family)